jgi:hypothetical protein
LALIGRAELSVCIDNELLGHGFIWEEGVITTIDHPDASFNTALYDINSRDNIVGFHDGQGGHSFALHQDKFRTLRFPSFLQDARIIGVNDKGQMVGDYFDEDGKFHGFLMR